MNKVRLAKLADFLETVPEDKFNMNVWANLFNYRSKLGDCGTAGCALGWATKIFPELELRWDGGSPYILLSSTSAGGLQAANTFFEIDISVSKDIFMAESYHSFPITPQQVAAKIRSYL